MGLSAHVTSEPDLSECESERIFYCRGGTGTSFERPEMFQIRSPVRTVTSYQGMIRHLFPLSPAELLVYSCCFIWDISETNGSGCVGLDVGMGWDELVVEYGFF